MENINLVLQNYLLLVIIVLLALVIMLYVMYKGQKKELQALKEKYDFFTQGDNVNWDELLTKTLTEVRAAKAEMQALEENQQAMREQMKSCVQKVKLMRYNAFADTGSDLSYSLSLLDENNNGVVLSSIYGREDNRTYAKPIKTENQLTTFLMKKKRYCRKILL